MVYARRTPDGSELLVIAVNSAAEHSHVEVCVAVRCSFLQCIAVRCCVLQCVVVYSILQSVTVGCNVMQCTSVCRSVL